MTDRLIHELETKHNQAYERIHKKEEY